jgi:multiple sugar transport system substrate-binding protein
MKQIAVCIIILFMTTFPHMVSAREKLVLSITGEDITDVVKKFNQSQSNYHVVLQNQEYRNWRFAINQFRFKQAGATKNAKGSVIDIAFIDNNWLAGMIQDQWLEDITGKIVPTNSLINGLLDAATRNGRLYALPFSNKGQVLFYRKDLHEKHGLSFPRTLKELEQNALVLIEREGLDHGLTIHFSAIHLDVLPFLWSNGGGIIENGDIIVNHPSNVETLTYLQGLVKKRVLPGKKTFETLKGAYSNAKKLFMEGRSAYILTWSNRVAEFEKSQLAGKFGIIPIPPIKLEQPSFSVIGSWYFAVNSFSDHKEGASQFLRYFFSDHTQIDLALKSNSFIPATRSVYSNSKLKSENIYLQELEAAMANMRHRLKHPKEPQISAVFENSIKEILIEGKSVKNLLDIAQQRIVSIINGKSE